MVTHEIKNLTDEKIQLSYAGKTEWFEPGETRTFDMNDPEHLIFLNIALFVIPNQLKGSVEINKIKIEQEEEE